MPDSTHDQHLPQARSPAARRWPRRALIALATLGALLAGAIWLLGREATLQQLARRLASASGGQLEVSGVRGSLYHRMHIGRLVRRGADSVVTADDIDINWSPLQFFSDGIAISELHVASLTVDSLGPSQPPTLPATLAAPFRIGVADARLARLTLLDHGSRNVIEQVRFQLLGEPSGWTLREAEAVTAIGRVQAALTLGARRPFALEGTASLSALNGGTAPPARLTARARGHLSLLELKASASAGAANGEAALTLAPFDAVILRALDLQARDLDPIQFQSGWPRARLALQLAARIAPGGNLSGQLALQNQGQAGAIDQQRLPLQGASARLGGTLTAASVDALVLDLGAAGRFQGSGRIAGANAGPVRAGFKLHTDRLDLQALYGSLRKSAIAGDIELRSDAGHHSLSAALAQDGLRLDIQAALSDALLQVRQASLRGKHGGISVSAQASLKNAHTFSANAHAQHFDPSAFGAYPVADLNAELDASGRLLPAWQAALRYTLKPSVLLGQSLSGSGQLTADARRVSAVQARLALGRNTVDLQGGLGAPGDQLRWKVDARALSAVHARLLGAAEASGVASGTLAAPRSSFTASATGLGLAPTNHPAPDGVLRASGVAWLVGQHGVELKLSGAARAIHPAAFGPYPDGAVNADFSADARLGGAWHAGLNLALLPSTLAGAPLAGHARLAADARHIDQADIDLHLGPNSLQARGAFGGARDLLEWKLDAPRLDSAGPRFGGALRAAGTLAGDAGQPALTLTLDGADLRAPGQQQLKTLRASASLGGANGALVSDLAVTGYGTPTLALDQLRLQTSGTRAAHVLQLSAANHDFDAALRLKGGWNGDGWNGVLDTLQNRGRYALTLRAPAPLRVAVPSGGGLAGLLHPRRIALGAASIALPAGGVRIDQLEKDGPWWRSQGRADGVPASYLAQLSDAWRDHIKSDLALGASWALTLRGGDGGAPAVDGMLHLYREQGDLTVLSADPPLPLGLRQLDARVGVTDGALRLQLALDGNRAGQANMAAALRLVDGKLTDASALTLTGGANMGSLAWLAPLTGQPGLELEGALKLAMTGGGTLGAPRFGGELRGERLVLNWAEQGIKLRNGQLQARLDGDQLLLQNLAFDGAEGKVRANGWLRYTDAVASMRLKLEAERLEVLARPDRTLVLSGHGTLARDARHFQLDGKFKAERANFELAAQDSPTLSDDVLIVGRGGAPVKNSPAMPLNIDLEAELGDAFHLKGKGLDAQLDGSVRIRVAERRPPRVTGGIRVASGTYVAYGQKLAIERGVINFTGAYDNPGLNILAVRKRPEGDALSETNVEAGVEIRGTALAPVAKLVSTPTVSDSDKLAWLVLGHGLDNAAGNDTALLGAAAGALFGGGQGRLASTLGVDELGVSQAKGLETTVVTVGKRLSSRAYLSFEQGANSATSLVKLRYKLNPRITLQFQTGTNNALDVLYTWAFD